MTAARAEGLAAARAREVAATATAAVGLARPEHVQQQQQPHGRRMAAGLRHRSTGSRCPDTLRIVQRVIELVHLRLAERASRHSMLILEPQREQLTRARGVWSRLLEA